MKDCYPHYCKDMASDNKRKILSNIIAAVVVLLLLIIGARILLSVITRHNRTVTVPDFTNMDLRTASAAASEADVKVKVIDSVFLRRLDAGVVYRQSPKAGSRVKKGRSIFITINSVVPRKTLMPNLVGYSLMEAKAEISNHGLLLGRLNYVPDLATNNVLDQKYRGRSVPAGSQIISGSEIDLTLGLSPDDNRTAVPYVVGMKYISAMDALHNNYLNSGKATFDKGIKSYADTVDAIVYRQEFAKGTPKAMGSPVALWLTLDESKIPAK